MKFFLSILLLVTMATFGQNPYSNAARQAADKTNLELSGLLIEWTGEPLGKPLFLGSTIGDTAAEIYLYKPIAEQRINRWARMVESKELSLDEFKFLVKSQFNILEMAHIQESLKYTRHSPIIACDHIWFEIPAQPEMKDTVIQKPLEWSLGYGFINSGPTFETHNYICLFCRHRFTQVVRMEQNNAIVDPGMNPIRDTFFLSLYNKIISH